MNLIIARNDFRDCIFLVVYFPFPTHCEASYFAGEEKKSYAIPVIATRNNRWGGK
jgi:hypothetical protein